MHWLCKHLQVVTMQLEIYTLHTHYFSTGWKNALLFGVLQASVGGATAHVLSSKPSSGPSGIKGALIGNIYISIF